MDTRNALAQYVRIATRVTSVLLRKIREIRYDSGMASPEIIALSQRLDLSYGDLLQIAREVAEDRMLKCVEDLTRRQTRQLEEYLEFLAQPVCA